MKPDYTRLKNDLQDYGQDAMLNSLFYAYQDFCSIEKNGILEK